MSNCQDKSKNRATISRYIQNKIHTGEGYMTPSTFLIPIETDMDTFPYPRFFRGMMDCTHPRVFEREAGHRRRNPQGYSYQYDPKIITPRRFEGCFQIPCSTILPCVNVETSYKRPIDYCINISP